tara:strand:- start:737 stop:3925 length:3189 start_codon:yes stop_codon:yes gene_type:complete
MIDFVHLHNHTTFSFLDGYGTPKQFLDQVEAIGHKAASITDHGNIWGHVPFMQEATKRDIKIIPGVEFYIVEDAMVKNKRHYFHITVLAKNQTGLENIHRLVTYSNMEGFYYKPRIDFKSLLAHSEGLIVLSGCMGAGVLLNIIEDDSYVERYLTGFKDKFKDDFYIEVSPQHRVKPEITKMIEIADNYKIKPVTSSDTHFPRKEDHSAEDLMLCIGLSTVDANPNRMVIMPELYLFDGVEAEKRGSAIYGDRCKELYDTTLEIADKVDIKRTKSGQKLFPLPEGFGDKFELFRRFIDAGVISRNLKNRDDWDIYKERLEYEVELIIEKDYVDYFLVIRDMIIWAKQRMLVGPARGSVAGSLVAYVLRITEVDPLEFGLLFERFIDVTRYDPPDIDVDFPDEKRQIVIDYMIDKYGEDYTSLLGTISTFKPRVAIWDTRRVYDLPWDEAKELASLILDRSSGDARAALCLEDTFNKGSDWYIERAGEIVKKVPKFRQAARLEGQARQTGMHAAAVVVSEKPLIEISGFIKGKKDEKILCLDKYGAEELGLLKIDCLGLKQLTVFEKVLTAIGKDYEWLYNLPKEDPKALKLFRDNKCWGVFQYEGDAVRVVNMQVQPDTFLNICEISALARPGALHCGGTTKYLNYRAYEKGFDRPSKTKPKYLHPLLKEMCSDTYGVVIYQEQVLRLTNEVGHMGWEASNQLRKAMSKSYGAEFFNKYKVKFVKGATEKSGLNKETAEILWDQLVTFGSWAFNKSHSVSYGHLSYWCAYLKAHYPAEFYLATLQKENDDDVIKKLLREWVQADGEFVVLDHNKSDTNFSLHDGIIYGGFRNLKGIGEKQAEKLVGNRPFSDANSLRKTATKKVLGVLKSLDALDTLPIDNSHQVNLFANDEELGFDDFGDIEKQGDIIEIAPWADLYPIGDKYDEFVANNNLEITNVEDIKETTTDVVCVVKIKHLNLRSIRETSVTQQRGKSVKNAHLDKFLNIYAEDDTETIILGISRYNYPKFGNKLFDHGIGTIVCIQGKKVRGFRKISVNNLKILKSANNFKENQEKYQESERQYA